MGYIMLLLLLITNVVILRLNNCLNKSLERSIFI